VRPRIESGDQVSLVSFRVEGRALGVSSRLGASVGLVDVGSVASKLIIWRTGFRYDKNNVVGYGTGTLEAGTIFSGACVSSARLSSGELRKWSPRVTNVTDFKNSMPSDSEGFILLDAHGVSAGEPLHYGDTVILRRMNGRYLNCSAGAMPAFRSVQCSADEKFRIWF
jgi:hypothetical protein